ncbi:hypothetical protein BDW68DRAFT_96533 [Aspergillus falconensis]
MSGNPRIPLELYYYWHRYFSIAGLTAANTHQTLHIYSLVRAYARQYSDIIWYAGDTGRMYFHKLSSSGALLGLVHSPPSVVSYTLGHNRDPYAVGAKSLVHCNNAVNACPSSTTVDARAQQPQLGGPGGPSSNESKPMLSGIKPYFPKFVEKLSEVEEAIFFSFSEIEGDPFRSILLLLLLVGHVRAYPACHALHLSIEQNRCSDRLPSVSSSIVDRRGAEGKPRSTRYYSGRAHSECGPNFCVFFISCLEEGGQ